MSTPIITHTVYSHYARLEKVAIDEIVNLRRYLFTDVDTSRQQLREQIEKNIAPYLVDVDLSQSPLQQQIEHIKKHPSPNPTVDQKKIEVKQKLIDQYRQRYHKAVQQYRDSHQQLIALISRNDVFIAPDAKQHEYLYMLDGETCRHLCDTEEEDEDCRKDFNNKEIELLDNQTDAVRIWRNNIDIENLVIRDQRHYTTIAHRDGIQLIPPPLYEKKQDDRGNIIRTKLADQMAGTVLEGVTINFCKIHSSHGALQGIFASDGMCRDLKITHTEIATKGAHSISIAGVLTGCEMSNITLRQVEGGGLPKINLYPLRLGGNIADDGVIYILDFMVGSSYGYGPVNAQNNKRYRLGSTQAEFIEINDNRRTIPRRHVSLAFGLYNFDYQQYLHEYTTWTVADFKRELPQAFQQMQAWLDLRISEFRRGRRVPTTGNPLPPISAEQMDTKQHGVLDMLIQANDALNANQADFNNTRLPELQFTAIRSFAIKCIALRNGKIEKLYDLGQFKNKLRKAYLHFLLDEQYFKNLTTNPYNDDEPQRNSTKVNASVTKVKQKKAQVIKKPQVIKKSWLSRVSSWTPWRWF